MKIGPYEGEVAQAWHRPERLETLARLEQWLPQGTVLQESRNRLIRCQLPTKQAGHDLMVKCFPPPAGLLRRFALRNSKARRAWEAAIALESAGVPTPPPVALLERRQGSWMRESYLITAYVPDLVSMREALNRIYRENPSSQALITLLQAVADTVRKLHQAGWLHYDLGNQNLLLSCNTLAHAHVLLVDLNRARRQRLTLRRIARDISRLCLPSDFRRILHEMYFDHARPHAFRRWEYLYRILFAWHTLTRGLRHPLRIRREPDTPVYPSPRNLWIWDEYSAQAISAWNSRDRRRLRTKSDGLRIAGACITAVRPLYHAYRQLQREAWQQPVKLKNRIGVAVSMHPNTRQRESEYLQALGPIPVLIRACYHAGPAGAADCLEAIQMLANAGHAVTLALVQDRRAVLNPSAWHDFAVKLLDNVAPLIDGVEIGHAVNRVKWGFWDFGDYSNWLQACIELPKRYPHLSWYGPATIDFEPYQTIGFLGARPQGVRFDAMSQHLYVDRRGAPENFQGRFSTLQKAILFRALARITPQCGDRLIVSEVNWPLQGTGIHSPVCSPYLYSGQTVDTNVSEEQAARYLLRYLLITLCSGMVDRVYWWQLAAHGYGLIDPDPAVWRPRPAYHAVQTFVDNLGETVFVRRPSTPSGVHAFIFAEDDRRHWLLYAHPTPQTYRPPVTWQRVVRLTDGALANSNSESSLDLTGAPVLLLDTR